MLILLKGKFKIFQKGNTLLNIGIIFLTILLLLIIVGPFVIPYSPYHASIAERLAPPVWMEGGTTAHIFGTDAIGRDLFVRMAYGLRLSLIIAFIVVGLDIIIGTTLGLYSGYFGGVLETIVTGLVEIQLSFPFIIMAVAILSLSTSSIPNIILVLVLSLWANYARLIHVTVKEQKDLPHIYAVRSSGAGNIRILFKHIGKSILPNILLIGILDIATVTILEAILGFLGIGVMPPTPSIGNIIADGKKYISSAWWIATLPGGLLFFTVLTFNLIGEGLRRKSN